MCLCDKTISNYKYNIYKKLKISLRLYYPHDYPLQYLRLYKLSSVRYCFYIFIYKAVPERLKLYLRYSSHEDMRGERAGGVHSEIH